MNMVDRYSEKRRASTFKSPLKDRKKTEQDEGDSSLAIVRNEQLNASSIMQSHFHLGQNLSGNDSVFQDFSLVESVFCTPSKVHNCLSYLNKEFAGMGLPPVVRSQSESTDVVRLVNNTYKLVQRQQQTHRMKEEQEIRQIQADGEVNRLHHVQTKMLAQIEEKERKLSQLQLLISQLEMKNKQLSHALKTEKEEVQRVQSVMQQRQVQYKHESKKKELEYNRLKDRLHQVLVERTEKPGMVISAVILPNPKFRNEDGIFRTVSANYEETQRKLLHENSDFHCMLCSFQNELMELVQMADSSINLSLAMTTTEDVVDSTKIMEASQISSTHANVSCQKLPNAFFEMPFELVENDILKSFQQKLSSLKSVIEQLKTQASVQKIHENEERANSEDANRKQDDEINRLQEKVENLRSIVVQQHAFIMNQFEQGTAEVSFLRDTDDLEEEPWSQAEQFVAEARQRLNDVTAKIAEEMAGKQAKNYHVLQEQFMTPLKSDRGHRCFDLLDQSLLEKSTTSKCEEPSDVSDVQTPSIQMVKDIQLPGTAELYKKLGLSAFVLQSSPFVAKSQDKDAWQRQDETKENIDPQDRLAPSVMEGADNFGGAPIGSQDQVKVQLFSKKLVATGMMPIEKHGNAFHQKLAPEILIEADLCKMHNDPVPSSVIGQDEIARGNLDGNIFVADYSDNDSIKFEEDDDDFFRNTFLSNNCEN